MATKRHSSKVSTVMDLVVLQLKNTVCVCVCVFFTLTDRASTIPSKIRGCRSVTWSAGQENIRGTSAKLRREHENKNDYQQ